MEEKTCPKCGTVNDVNAKFCVGCAAEFALLESEQAAENTSEEDVVVQDDLGGDTVTGEFVDAPVEESVEAAEEVVREQPVVEAVAESQEVTEGTSVETGAYDTAPAPIPVAVPEKKAKKEKKVKEKKVKKEKQVEQNMPVPGQSIEGYAPKPVSVIGWIGLILVRIIPLGVIIELVIALSSSNPTLRNYGKAKLILIIIGVVLVIAGFIALLPVIQDVYDNIYDLIDVYS